MGQLRILRLPIWIGRKAWQGVQKVRDLMRWQRESFLEYKKLHDPQYKYPPGCFPVGTPIRQGLVSIAGVPLQAYPLAKVPAASKGVGYYIPDYGLRPSPYAPGTGLKVPVPDCTFKSHLSVQEYLDYVSPITGVPM